MKSFMVGTRGSNLALKQTEEVISLIRDFYPGIEIKTKVIKTTGDRLKDAPIKTLGNKGVFVKEIEEALAGEEIDLAVHSLKDLPAELPPGLMLGAVTRREDPRDAWISNKNIPLSQLPTGSTIGTSSLRRAAQLSHYFPDITIFPLRGNLPTRLKKTFQFEGIVLAMAGLKRMGLNHYVTEVISPEICLPSVGQGGLGIEIRENDEQSAALVENIHHNQTWKRVKAERAFQRELEGGCQAPIAGFASIDKQTSTGEPVLSLSGMVAGTEGKPFFREEIKGDPSQCEELGKQLARDLLKKGAGKILNELRSRGDL